MSFNPRTRKGCDQRHPRRRLRQQVSIHAPARGATQYNELKSYIEEFQSTHPQGVRLVLCKLYTLFNRVSIHAPARGATIWFLHHHHTQKVSIHAPARGATFGLLMQVFLLQGFNPRTRKGCDIRYARPRLTHTRFNPRTRKGCDLLCYPAVFIIKVSIHAPARGAT